MGMIRILSVSYDRALLNSRQLLLESCGYRVVSIPGLEDGLQECKQGPFDLFILGHSIPRHDKEALVAAFRAHSRAPIVALKKFGEETTSAVDFEIDPEPAELLAVVSRLLPSSAASARPA
jgi:DNA-binding response OmpR family regulator